MGDLVEPGARVLGLLQRVVVLVRLDEGVLGQVGGELRVAQHAHQVRVDLAVVLGEQRLDERAPRCPRDPRIAAHRTADRSPTSDGLAEGIARSASDGIVDHRSPCGMVSEARSMGGARSSAQRRGAWPRCDARALRAGARQRRRPRPARSAEQLLDGVLGRDRVHRQARAELEAGDLAQARVDLPVPVERRVDLLPQRRRVQDEVVRRAVEAGAEPRRAPGGAPRPWPRPRASSARPKSASWRRGTIQTSNGEREAYGANATLASSSQTSRSRRAAPRGRGGRTGTPLRGSRIGRRRPAPRATRCGICGRSYRSRHR